MSTYSITAVCANPAIDTTLRASSHIVGGTNIVSAASRCAGGKGVNVALIASGLGQRVRLTGLFGEESLALFSAACESASVSFEPVAIPGAVRENIKVFDESRGVTTEFNAKGAPVGGGAAELLLRKVVESARDSDWLVLTGSLPQGFPEDWYGAVARAARGANPDVLIALDASGAALRLGLEARPDLAKPNIAELSELSGRELRGFGAAADSAAFYASRGTRMLVSLGGDGALLVSGSGVYRSVCAGRATRSTVGAGDSMVAAFVSAKCAGEQDDRAFELACAAAANRVGAR